MAELYGKAHEQGRVYLALVSRRGQHGVKPLLGNAGPIRDRRYRADPDAGMPMPD